MTRGNQNWGGGTPVDSGGDSGDGSDENVREDSDPVVRPDGGRPKDRGNAGDSTADSRNAGNSTADSGNTGAGAEDGRSAGDGTGDSGNGGGRAESSASSGGRAANSGNDGPGRATDGGSEEASDGSEESTGPEGDEAGEHCIYHRKVTPDAEEANESLLRLIANLERCEVTDLPPLYDQIDHMVEHLFTEPPPTDAQVELEFTYHGYRIELDQSGDVKFMKVPGEAPDTSDE